MKNSIFVKSYGCQMNNSDTDSIIEMMSNEFNLINSNSMIDTDFVILNSCSIREKASNKLFSDLGRLRLIKQNNKNMIIAVGGCVSVQEGKNIFKRAPYVNIIFGPQTIHKLPEMYDEVISKKTNHIINVVGNASEKFEKLPLPTKSIASATIPIIEGCNKCCSYCIVPYTRGKEVSRDIYDILRDVHIHEINGVKEIHLIGQNVTGYFDNKKQITFVNLLEEIANTSIERIKFTTSHPLDFSNDLIIAFKNISKLSNHLHLPLQSGSNKILKLMQRGYDISYYKEIVKQLKNIRDNICISTDIIVGFPNEEDEDFMLTMDIVKQLDFDNSFSFIYSERPNTIASTMLNLIPMKKKKERLFLLQRQLNHQVFMHNLKMIETIQNVLVTNQLQEKPNHFYGRSENNKLVHFTSEKNVLGTFVKVKITEAFPTQLNGNLL